MIKLFRRVRQRLLTENKFSRYFLYGVGEILLVVIGILIAVQINAWHENRTLKINETNILSQLNIDLKENHKELLELYEFMEVSNLFGKKILNHLQYKNEVTYSLRYWVEGFGSNNIFNNANTTYKNLENSSNNIISNDSLRLRITLMYELDFSNVHRREAMLYAEYFPNYKKELLKNFKISPVMNQWLDEATLEINTPINLKELKQNESYKNALVDLYNFRALRLKWLKKSLVDLEQLIKAIDCEIKETLT
ncbi:hypothetical protein [uncultured Winogradskyella sp.]|uniref:hypothetical protein n=1 Tax=uncultured Winogradskyella sp. TaxID=395353 RepID=UPI0030D9926E|tara:strand:+ start:14340 stop:15095 length:756 start_codon:yes stop_codon:yes gene_type:complete